MDLGLKELCIRRLHTKSPKDYGSSNFRLLIFDSFSKGLLFFPLSFLVFYVGILKFFVVFTSINHFPVFEPYGVILYRVLFGHTITYSSNVCHGSCCIRGLCIFDKFYDSLFCGSVMT